MTTIRGDAFCGIDDMAGIAGFASETTPRGNISVLSIRSEAVAGRAAATITTSLACFMVNLWVPILTGNRLGMVVG